MKDETENVRRNLVAETNADVESPNPDAERKRLESNHGVGNVWNTTELSAKFEVIGFMAPFCVVRDRVTGAKGSVQFQHSPRFYFNFVKAGCWAGTS